MREYVSNKNRVCCILKEDVIEQKVLKKIERYICEYDKIFILRSNDDTSKNFIHSILRQTGKKSLVLVNESSIDSIFGYANGACIYGADKLEPLGYEIAIEAISFEEYCAIERLYYTYEFSDHVHLIDGNVSYGSLDNYISNGLLTELEVVKALFK